MRPSSIVTFERCYLASFAIDLLNTILSWPALIAAMRANPSLAHMGPGFASTVTIGVMAVVAAVTLALWYFVARVGSSVAKWIVVILVAMSIVRFFYGMASGTRMLNVQGIVDVVTYVLDAVAVWMLFRPDARAWFGERDAAAETLA